MSLLKDFENKLESLLEGFFAKSFRSGLHPLEIAKKLARAMSENKVESVSRVYVPNTYTILMNNKDYERLSSLEEPLVTELADFCRKHALEEGFTIVGEPEIGLLAKAGIGYGELKVDAEHVTPKDVAALDGEARVQEPGKGALTLVNTGNVFLLGPAPTTIGRLDTNDIVIEDPMVSRLHAEIRPESGSFTVVDLGSTNGTFVGGERVSDHRLEDGDTITVGETKLEFRRE